MNDPWEKIRRPATGISWLLRSAMDGTQCQFGLSADGRIGFMIEATEDHSVLLRDAPALESLAIDFEMFSETGIMGLTVWLRQERDRALFAVLCDDLAGTAQSAGTERQAFLSVIGRLERWQRFLSRGNPGLLSQEEVRGLFGELSVLNSLAENGWASRRRLITCWDGPAPAPQDFRFEEFCIEVKSVSSGSDGRVRISSEFQFYDRERAIYLAIIELKEDAEVAGATSLNELVAATREHADADILPVLDVKLEAAGYLALPFYDQPKFTAGRIRYFEVREGFPALHIGNIPPGTADFRYSLDSRTLTPFIIDDLPELK